MKQGKALADLAREIDRSPPERQRQAKTGVKDLHRARCEPTGSGALLPVASAVEQLAERSSLPEQEWARGEQTSTLKYLTLGGEVITLPKTEWDRSAPELIAA